MPAEFLFTAIIIVNLMYAAVMHNSQCVNYYANPKEDMLLFDTHLCAVYYI